MKFRLKVRKPAPLRATPATPLHRPAPEAPKSAEREDAAKEPALEPALLSVMEERAKRGLDPDPGDPMLSREELLALYELNQEEPRHLRPGTSGFDRHGVGIWAWHLRP
jgi:hypothetical protein